MFKETNPPVTNFLAWEVYICSGPGIIVFVKMLRP